MLRSSFTGICPHLLSRTPYLLAHYCQVSCVKVLQTENAKRARLKDSNEEHLKRLDSTLSSNYINQVN